MNAALLLLVGGLSPFCLEPRLEEHLESVGPHEPVPVLVVMQERVDARALQRETARVPRRDRAAATKARLEPIARASQRELEEVLDGLRALGQVTSTERLWTVNAMRVEGTRAAIRRIAEVPGVERVRWDPPLAPERIEDSGPPFSFPLGDAPFGTSFETGAIPAELELQAGAGSIQVTPQFGASDGFFHLTMDSPTAGPVTLQAAILHFDLADADSAVLTFDAATYDGGGTEQGVWISVDGGVYVKALALPAATPYQGYVLDIGAFLANESLPFSNDVRIAFRWGSSGPIPTSGLTLDDIRMTATYQTTAAEPNVAALQADQLWALGVNGGGVLVINVDSGVAIDHPALVDRIWVNPGEIVGNGLDDDANGKVDDIWGWDFQDDDNFPYGIAHGTATAGIINGNGAGNGGVRTGMAPEAVQAVARINSEGTALAAFQYAIDIGADVITSSLSFKWPDQPDYQLFRQSSEVELAAGLIHAHSIGNEGLLPATHPVPFNISTPGNCPGPWRHPLESDGGRGSVIACAAIDFGTESLLPGSGIGPSAWDDLELYASPWPYPQDPAWWDFPWDAADPVAKPGLLKPDLAGYAMVRTTAGSTGYSDGFTGTSAATPHVAGALCLLLDANPRVLPRQMSMALQQTAADIGPAGKDTSYGAGKVQAFDAAMRVASLVTAYPPENLLGETSNVEITGPFDAFYVLIAGFLPGNINTSFGFTVGIKPPLFLSTGRHTGYTTPKVLPLKIPNDPSLSGFTLLLQVVTDDTTGFYGQWLSSVVEKVRWD